MWSTSEFEAQLRAVGERRYHHLHPFHVRMHAGGLSKEEFQAWVVNRFYYQVSIPVKDSYILAKLPSREDRQRWIQRIHDHDGREGESGGIERWLRLGEAVGTGGHGCRLRRRAAGGTLRRRRLRQLLPYRVLGWRRSPQR